jgi:hypothetical protein
MKNKAKELLFFLVNPIFLLFFKIAIKKIKYKKIWIVDIDNTIANSSNPLTTNKSSNFDRLLNLEVLIGTQKLIHNLKDTEIIYLSARNYIYYFTTKSWLKKHSFLKNPFNLILVLHPDQKVSYLKKIAGKYDVTLIDDLSFNQENGSVKYYTDTIEQIKKLPIVYEYIKKLNSSYDSK